MVLKEHCYEPLVKEVTVVLREWGAILKKMFPVSLIPNHVVEQTLLNKNIELFTIQDARFLDIFHQILLDV